MGGQLSSWVAQVPERRNKRKPWRRLVAPRSARHPHLPVAGAGGRFSHPMGTTCFVCGWGRQRLCLAFGGYPSFGNTKGRPTKPPRRLWGVPLNKTHPDGPDGEMGWKPAAGFVRCGRPWASSTSEPIRPRSGADFALSEAMVCLGREEIYRIVFGDSCFFFLGGGLGNSAFPTWELAILPVIVGGWGWVNVKQPASGPFKHPEGDCFEQWKRNGPIPIPGPVIERDVWVDRVVFAILDTPHTISASKRASNARI